MNKILKKLHTYVDEYYKELCKKEEIKLEKQKIKALKSLCYWKNKLKQENPRLFWYTINVKIPYWEHWIKKYKTTMPSMQSYFERCWEGYHALKNTNDLKDNTGKPLDTLF